MDDLLLSITSFTCIRSYSVKFYTDKGAQLSKASSFIDSKENPANWTWDKIKDTLATKKTEVIYCLPGFQWQNGTAEQWVWALKDTLELTMCPGSNCLYFIEFRTLLTKCADIINSRPIWVLLAEDDLQPLTPKHLLICRASLGQFSQESLGDGDKYCKMLKHITELSNQWWNLWLSQVFLSLLPFKCWTRRQAG